MRCDITYAGTQEHELLLEEVSEDIPQMTGPAVYRQLQNMRRLWVLNQYLKGRSSTMTGPVMGPVYRQLVKEGFIEEA